jgi:hypothetical protein
MTESFETKLVNFLLDIPAMDDRSTRNILLKDIPQQPISQIPRHSAPKQDLVCIVSHVIKFGIVNVTMTFAVEILIKNTKQFVEGLEKASQLDALLQEFQADNQSQSGSINIPFVIVSMTSDEAIQLKDKLNSIDTNSGNHLNSFQDLTKSLQAHEIIDFTESYGKTREDWKPYNCDDQTIEEIIMSIVEEVNEYHQLQGINLRTIQPYFLSTDCFESDLEIRNRTWNQLGKQGCVIIVDSLSLFNVDVREKLLQAQISSNEKVSIITISPVNPCMIEANDILERFVSGQMQQAFLRFNEHLDRRCEIGAGNLRSMRRWFFSVLPETVEIISKQKAQPNNRQYLSEAIGPRRKMDTLWTGGNT